MNTERWQQLKQVVGDALELAPAERSAFVERACGDDTKLRAEVESMLAGSGDRIEAFATDLDSSLRHAQAENSRAGVRLGAYEIVREIGRGGMGAVYLARRADEQFQKQVAIKILKRGTDTEDVLRRFGSERQILARLEHPNIARLIDAGTTGDGLPYFVMEYVEGIPIDEFCAARELNLRERLELFIKVCGAIYFAHQNLIVHRDLKPGNILVTPDGEPKLLDFGIAKLLDATEAITIADRQRFTPNYASPEQVRGEPITTVSDVYSLGALLYELLVGSPPHRFSTAEPSPTELFRVIGEQEPLRPSAAVAGSGSSQAATARIGRGEAVQNRSPRTSATLLRGDLDNIILQALRKEPQRRYPGVNALAEDIRRYLSHFPVRARKDTIGYRTSKFVRRHWAGVAAASVVVIALVAGLALAAWQARVARTERAKAVHRFNQVRQLARAVMFDYHDQIAALPGSTAVRQTLVRDALKYLDNLSQEAADDRSLLRELADAYEKVAAVQAGVATSTRGTALSAANLGDTAGGLASEGKAIAIREQLMKNGGNDLADRKALAVGYVRMAGFYVFSGPPQKAIESYRKAEPILESLLAAHPANEDLLLLTADVYVGMAKALGSPGGPNLGDTNGALEYMRKGLAIRERLTTEHSANIAYKSGLAVTHNTLGLIHNSLGQREVQLEHNLKALAINREIVVAAPENPLYRRELAIQLGNIGSTLMQLKEKPRALEHFWEALHLYDGLAAADPHDVGVRRQWAVAHRNMGVALGASAPEAAFRHFDKATEILAEIVTKDPNNTDFRRQWAFTYLAKSRFQLEINDPAAAVASAHEGIRIGEELSTASPADVAVQNTLALLFTQLGASHVRAAESIQPPSPAQHWRNAKDAYTRSLEIYQSMKAKGTLAGENASKPEELARELAKCDAALVAASLAGQ